jgi:hypothetical protein
VRGVVWLLFVCFVVVAVCFETGAM